MRRWRSLARPVALAFVLSPGLAQAAPASVDAPPPSDVLPPLDAPPEAPPPSELPPPEPAPLEPAPEGPAPPPEIPADSVLPPESLTPPETPADGETAPSDDAAPKKTKKKPKKPADAAPTDDGTTKPKKKKPKKPKEKHKVYQGTEYNVGVYGAGYVQGQSLGLGVQAGVRQRLEPKKNQPLVLGLGYEFEPFSTKVLGFPEEDEVMMEIRRTLVQPIHILSAQISRQLEWGKLVKTGAELEADAWWPDTSSFQRRTVRFTPRIRIGRSTGPFGELSSELYYKKFPNYYIDSVQRRIDQEGLTPTATVGYNVRKLGRFAGGFAIDFTHYLDARYNARGPDGSFVAPDGSFIRARDSKNYIDYIPFADIVLRPVKGLRIRLRYAYERQKTQHYDRVMTGRDEFASLVPKLFHGYYDYRRHRGNLWLSWKFRDRLELTAAAAAWLRHFDVYEARTVDNFWTGQLRLDTELEGSLGLAVRAFSIKRPRIQHDFYVSLFGSHVTRRSNQRREISLATNFDITRVLLGVEVRAH